MFSILLSERDNTVILTDIRIISYYFLKINGKDNENIFADKILKIT